MGSVLVLVGVAQEFQMRARLGVGPRKLRDIWVTWLDRKRNPQQYALLFASISALAFSFWESFLRFLFGREDSIATALLSSALFVIALRGRRLIYLKAIEKQGSPLRFTFQHLALFWAGWCVATLSWFTLPPLTLWLVLRSRYLRVSS